jgi:hypothetical protein
MSAQAALTCCVPFRVLRFVFIDVVVTVVCMRKYQTLFRGNFGDGPKLSGALC